MTTPATALPTISGGGTIILNALWVWSIDFGVDLTGLRFRLQVRASADPADIDVLLDASTDNGRLVTTGTRLSSNVLLHDLDGFVPGTVVADIVAIDPSGNVVNLCPSGPLTITVREGITR